MTGLGETPWVDRHLGLAWERVRSVVPNEDWLPMVAEEGGRAKVYVEHGCGHYGCVMPTYDPNVVAKLTSDESEAYLVGAAIAMNDENAWNGMVEYFDIYQLKAAFHRRRPLYILWREAAHDVGFQALELRYRGDDYKRRQFEQIERYLDAFRWSADAVRAKLERSGDPYKMVADAATYEQWAWNNIGEVHVNPLWRTVRDPFWARTRGAQGVAAHLRHCQIIAEQMQHTYMADGLGEALSFYLEQGLLLADVHANNIGLVTNREDYDERIVITDPGHAVPLIERWDAVEIEEI